MAGPMGRYEYQADDGNTYTVRLDASNAAAMLATAAASPGQTYPKGWVPRYLLVQHPTTGRQRRLVVPDPTAAGALWTTQGGSVSLMDYGLTPPAAATWGIRGRCGERRYARAN
jgi:hypothetical protein